MPRRPSRIDHTGTHRRGEGVALPHEYRARHEGRSRDRASMTRLNATGRNPRATGNKNGVTACAVTPRLPWLRGLDLNQRPLGYEPGRGHHPPRSPATVCREIVGIRSSGSPLFALVRGGSGHTLGTAHLPPRPALARVPCLVDAAPQLGELRIDHFENASRNAFGLVPCRLRRGGSAVQNLRDDLGRATPR